MLAALLSEQEDLHRTTLPPLQVSVLRVLYDWIHQAIIEIPLTSLTQAVNLDLEKCRELCRLNERKLGDILTSLALTDRVRKNVGYVLRLNKSDWMRIHRAVRDYGVAPIRTFAVQSCAICTELVAPPNNTSAPPKTQENQKVQSQTPNGRRERREHRACRVRAPRLRRQA